MRVDEVMTPDVVSVSGDVPLREVARILAKNHISGLPVLDSEGRLAGVVSECDVLVKEMEPQERRGGVIGWLLDPDEDWRANKLAAQTAAEAMSSPALHVGPNASVARAATLMVEKGVNRLPVVDEAGVVVGIVTRSDLVKAFTQSDAEIEREIREEVIEHQLWSASDLAVDVNDGVVTVTGEVENEALASALPNLVARVPGVVEIDSRITWLFEGSGDSSPGATDALTEPGGLGSSRDR